MRFRAGLVLGLGVSLGFGLQAKADTVAPTGGSVGGFSGDGTLYAVSNGTGSSSYTITSIAGPGVTGLIAPGGFDGNLNQLYPSSGTTLDASGFAFTDTMGDTNFQVDIYGEGNGKYGAYIVDSDGITISDAATFTLGSPITLSSPAATSRMALLREAVAVNPPVEEFSFSFASVQAAAATPEPGGFALMGTGLLGAAAMVRRRLPR